ncbi:RNA polymerase-binding protein DksA [Rudaea sp.]|uniref:RNA polymerase-binding protein DksA n=1 Tax=Rudaea sp. TaxID=2136325 RepID=UPI0039E65028
MATSKRKPASPAKKKAGPAKAGATKKPAPKKAAPKKAPAKKPAKAAATKRATGKAVASKKPVAKKTHAKPVVKPQRPARKLVAAKKPASKSAAAKPARPARPAPKPATKKPASPKPAAPTKGKMSAVAPVPDTVTREDGRYALPSTVVIDLPANYRPSAKEEYMGPRHLAYFRAKLQKWREDLVEESKQTIDNLRDEVRDVGDEAERATRETENSLELRTRDRYRKLIGKIDKALKRIEEGRYGYCEETDEEIGIERLEARPIATLSLDAQERWEHRQKQMGD